jgi:cyclophilin family peptidyl-prolyl cis-trans isomerase
MPKKKKGRQTRSYRQSPVVSRSEEREPGMLDRIKKNPFTVLLGVVVIGSMVLGLGSTLIPERQVAPALPTATAVVQAAVQPTAVRKTYPAMPAMVIDAAKSYVATMTTSKGVVKLQLLPAVAPKTVNAFVALSRDGYYDGLTFHRVEDWVVQGGDPTGTGGGGPGYNLPAEFSATKHVTGTLAMARSSDPNSAGSQFYVVKKEASWLDGQYTVFGQTLEGMDVINKLVKGDVIQSIVIEEK